MSIIDEIAAERVRQIASEGYSPAHDDEHGNCELARGAAYYALWTAAHTYEPPSYDLLHAADRAWPWRATERKPKNVARHNLIRAAALIVAEIERLDRAAARKALAV